MLDYDHISSIESTVFVSVGPYIPALVSLRCLPQRSAGGRPAVPRGDARQPFLNHQYQRRPAGGLGQGSPATGPTQPDRTVPKARGLLTDRPDY